MIKHIITTLVLFSVAETAIAQRKKNAPQTTSGGQGAPLTPAETIQGFKVPEGFVVELIASEENGLVNPIDMTFDDAGRLWTQTARMYPLDPIPNISFGKAMKLMQDRNLAKKYPVVAKYQELYQLKKKGADQILIIKDPTKQAKGQLHVWADGLTIPQSIMPYKNGAYVAHGSELFFLSDENGDGKQDEMAPKFTGFGIFDTHTMAHSIVRGPGGWMHFSHGAVNSGDVKVVQTGKKLNVTYSKNLRFKNDASDLEIINCHRDNNWGYQIRENGHWYATSANDGGYSVLPYEFMTSIPGNGNEKIREYAPFFPSVHKFRVGGTGISGLAFSENGTEGFPSEWNDVAFLANPMTRAISAVKIKRNTDGSITAEHLPDFLSSKDEWFRPVNIEFGPDGCLYIADWYNKIISHNEVRRDHPDRDKKHGRIWRIRHKSQIPKAIPNLITASNSNLLKHLSAQNQWEKRAAWHQIVDREAKELAPQIKAIIADSEQSTSTRITALWALEGLGVFDQELLAKLMASGDDYLKREAIRALGTYQPGADTVAALVAPYLEDKNAMVRSQVIRTLEESKAASTATITLLVKACKPSLPGNSLGGNYERNFERFLARKALESYTSELKKFLSSPEAAKASSENLLWALQALKAKEREDAFISIWKKSSDSEIDDNTFIAISRMLGSKRVQDAVLPRFKKESDKMLGLALKNSTSINGPNIARIYIKQIDQMLNSRDEKRVSKALDIIAKLHSPHHTAALTRLIPEYKKSSLFSQLVSAIGNDPKAQVGIYQKLFDDPDLAITHKLQALSALLIKNPKLKAKGIEKWISSLSDVEKQQAAYKLSVSKPGAALVQNLVARKVLPASSISYNSAIIMQKLIGNRKKEIPIFTNAKKAELQRQNKLEKKTHSYIAAIAKLEGNANTGKAIFESCLACHAVGGRGQQIAPALDGGKDRDTAHLITAIMNPDAAVEAVYGLHYVVRKDGFMAEGYLKKSDDAGITIASPGGAITFIPRHLLLHEGSIDGKSFMPSSYGVLPEQAIADLAAYIKTIK